MQTLQHTSPLLQPLAPVVEQVNVLTGLADNVAIPREGEGVGDHARAAATWLTGVHVKKTEGADIRAGTSLDQIVAQEPDTQAYIRQLEQEYDAANGFSMDTSIEEEPSPEKMMQDLEEFLRKQQQGGSGS